MSGFGSDIRQAIRGLRARPTFSLIAILTLALGIGANTAIFSLIRSILIEPLPYAAADRIVMFWRPGESSELTWLSQRELLEYRKSTTAFDQIASFTRTTANLTEGAEPERVRAARVTGNLFETLGVGAYRGRTFLPEEDVPGGDNVVLIGYDLWQRRFAGASDIIGSTLRVDGRSRTVVGIMPRNFWLPLDYREEQASELWFPAAIDVANPGHFGVRNLFIVARVRDDLSADAASADIAKAERSWEQQGLILNYDPRFARHAIPLNDLLTETVRPALFVLFVAVGFILVMACANVMNLLLARSDARRREVATLAALGASHMKIVRHVLIESGLLAVAGTILGIGLAYLGLKLALAVTPVNLIRMRGVNIDAAVLGFSAVLALGSTLLAGLAPALQLARVDLTTVMGAGGRGGATTVRRRVRNSLVVAQTAMAVLLLIGAGLLIRSLMQMNRIDLGFQSTNILTMRLSLPGAEYNPPERAVAFYRDLINRLEGIPGVQSAAAVRLLPLTGTIGDLSITIEGRPRAGENVHGDWQVITPGYIETMGLKVVRGRSLAATDDENAPLVALVDENMAARYWPGQDALGKRFHLGTQEQPWITIIGITRPVRHNAVLEEARTEMLLPHAQLPRLANSTPLSMTLVIRTDAAPTGFIAPVREQVRSLDPKLPVAEVRTMEEVRAAALSQPRFVTQVLGFFAALALLLAGIGMYAVVAYTTSRRRNEIGVRMALGAEASTVLSMVLREGIFVAAIGAGFGVFAAFLLTRYLTAQLYEIAPVDPITFLIVPTMLLLIAAAAAWLPAKRASATTPLIALRSD